MFTSNASDTISVEQSAFLGETGRYYALQKMEKRAVAIVLATMLLAGNAGNVMGSEGTELPQPETEESTEEVTVETSEEVTEEVTEEETESGHLPMKAAQR